MKLFKDMDWYEQSCAKLGFASKKIEFLKEKKTFDNDDLIMLNLLLTVLKSPMEYAIAAIQESNGVTDQNSYVPFKHNNQKMRNYIRNVKTRLGTDSQEIIDALLELQSSDIYNQFNTMQNNEKHGSINSHNIQHTQHIGFAQIGGLTFSNVSFINNGTKGIFIANENSEIDLTSNPTYSYTQNLKFNHNNEDVFEFLELIHFRSSKFIEKVYSFLNYQTENPSSDDQETRQVNE